MGGRKPRWHCQVALTVGGASVSVVTYAVVAVWFCQCFAPSSDRCDDDLLVSESRASVRHDAVWKLGNLRLSGQQHKGGRKFLLVGTVNDRYVLLVFGFTVACSTRRASMHADVLPRLLRDDGNPPKLWKRHIVVLCLVA